MTSDPVTSHPASDTFLYLIVLDSFVLREFVQLFFESLEVSSTHQIQWQGVAGGPNTGCLKNHWFHVLICQLTEYQDDSDKLRGFFNVVNFHC